MWEPPIERDVSVEHVSICRVEAQFLTKRTPVEAGGTTQIITAAVRVKIQQTIRHGFRIRVIKC
jgi:hypothetical protein